MRTIWGKLGQFGNIGTIWEYKDNLRKFSKLHTISQIVLIKPSIAIFPKILNTIIFPKKYEDIFFAFHLYFYQKEVFYGNFLKYTIWFFSQIVLIEGRKK